MISSFDSVAYFTINQAAESHNRAEMKRWLSTLNGCRIVVPVGNGFGEIAASITSALALRQFGYQGNIEFVYNERLGIERKVRLLTSDRASEIKPFSLLFRHSDSWGSGPDLTPVDLAIIPSGDCLSALNMEDCGRWNSVSVLTTRPTGWPLGKESIRVIGQRELYLDKYRESSAGALYAVPNVSPHMQTLIDEALNNQLLSLEQANFLRKVLELKQSGTIRLQFIYGLFDKDVPTEPGRGVHDELRAIIDTVETAFSPLDKPIVIVALQNLSSERQQKLTALTDTLLPQTHLFCISDLPPKLFETLLCEGGTLPPVVEGANNTALLEASGKPYLHGKRPLSRPPERKGNERFQAMQELHLNACKFLEGEDTEKLFAATVDFLKIPEDEKHTYFVERKAKYEAEMYDKLFTGLWNIKRFAFPPAEKRFQALFDDVLRYMKKTSLKTNLFPLLKRLCPLIDNDSKQLQYDNLVKTIEAGNWHVDYFGSN